MRDGADHLMTVEYDTKRMTTCPIRAVEQYIAVGTALGWNMAQGYLFPRISRRLNTGLGGRRPYQHQIWQRRSKYTRITPGNAPRSACTPSRIRRGAYTGSSRGRPAYGNATRILEEAEYGLEIPQTHGSTNPRIGRKLDKRERKYGGTQSRNTNKSLIYVPTANCIPSKWVR